MVAWLIWILVAGSLALGEAAIPGLSFLGPFATAALLSALAAAAGIGTVLQLIVFSVVAVAALALWRARTSLSRSSNPARGSKR